MRTVVPLLAMAACGDGVVSTPEIPLDAPDAPDAADAATRPAWILEATLPFDIAPTSANPAVVGHRSAIFVGIETNTPGVAAWRAIDVSAAPELGPPRSLPPADLNDFCFCGATQAMASDGTDSIYMFGNWGQRYEVSTDRWVEIPQLMGDLRRGEAAMVFNPVGPSVVRYGGRDGQNGPSRDVLGFAPPDGEFSTDAVQMPIAFAQGAAWLPHNGDAIFVTGGYGALFEPQRHMFVRPIAGGAWTVHPEVEANLNEPFGMGDFQQRIWIAADGRLHFFNPATSTWDRTIDAPAGTRAVVTADDRTWALARSDDGQLDLYRLDAIQ